jgi:hypothetical protein
VLAEHEVELPLGLPPALTGGGQGDPGSQVIGRGIGERGGEKGGGEQAE